MALLLLQLSCLQVFQHFYQWTFSEEHFVSLLIIMIVTTNDFHHYQDDLSPSCPCPCPACWCRLSTEKKGETQYENYLYRATSTSWHCISGDMRQTINIESEIRLSAWYQVTWDRNWHWKSGDLGETVGLPSSFPMGERMLQREDSWWWQVFLVFLFHALLFWYNKNCSSLSLECQSYSQTGFSAVGAKHCEGLKCGGSVIVISIVWCLCLCFSSAIVTFIV